MYCYRLLQASIVLLAVLTLVQAQKLSCVVKEPPGNADFCAKHGNAHLGCKNNGVRNGNRIIHFIHVGDFSFGQKDVAKSNTLFSCRRNTGR